MEEIVLKRIEKQEKKILYHYIITDNLKKYIHQEKQFYIEYSSEKMEGIPDSILNIPFLCNFLPIAWISNATIKIEQIDKSFLESIEDFKEGYKKNVS